MFQDLGIDEPTDNMSLDDFNQLCALIKAKGKVENDTAQAGPMARLNVDIELFNVKKNKTFMSFTVSKREGHNSIEEAARKAVRGLKAELVKKIQDAIKAKFGG